MKSPKWVTRTMAGSPLRSRSEEPRPCHRSTRPSMVSRWRECNKRTAPARSARGLVAQDMRASWVEEVESFNLERKERSMATIRVHDSDGKGRARRRLTQVASLALGLAMFGTVGLSGTLAQENDMAAGADAESIVNSIIQQVFGQIFGGGGVD